ncbi:ABC transporter ATP-binding protein [Marinococcus sp. PL1-022]|uniref:ABC transporter ATP-binding protein n=1 Tax=Marinococcus sp. PL1-022 TaxID=3095363 RepID=UPI0029C591C1|nr:ABC transporter ATP-binding protein [Marinococcus sp. PL1-022]MDX6152651.1 ABC transporter ATP-binding protein [Marinococcus sp. PL1-022]
MEASSSILRLENISLKHRFQPLTFSITKGSIYALCGGNGAGKTSLFSVLTGMNRPSSGTMYMSNGEIQNHSNTYRQSFSYMPDQLVFPRHLTGIETLRFFSDLMGEQQYKVTEILPYVGLEEAKDQKVKTYSKGMQQRLNLAQCLMADVPLYMLDEPTNGLDPYWAYQMKDIILDQKKKGKTIIFSTHSLSLVDDIADDLLFLQQGKVLINEPISHLQQQFGDQNDLSSYVYHLVASQEHT